MFAQRNLHYYVIEVVKGNQRHYVGRGKDYVQLASLKECRKFKKVDAAKAYFYDNNIDKLPVDKVNIVEVRVTFTETFQLLVNRKVVTE